MKQTCAPRGRDEARVRRVLEHYDAQSDGEAVAEDEAAYESTTHTAMETPVWRRKWAGSTGSRR